MDGNLHCARILSVVFNTIPSRSGVYPIESEGPSSIRHLGEAGKEGYWKSKTCTALDAGTALRAFLSKRWLMSPRPARRDPEEIMPEVLLADDNPSDVYLIREALREHGVDCVLRVASDGKDALGIISNEAPDMGAGCIKLIILDLNLPRHDGIEILQRLRSLPWLEGVPVVVLTSSDSPRDRLMANQLGATRYLRKPSSLDEFLGLGAIFKELLGQNQKSIPQGGSL
jgi:CheY-like chemotaxis protein